MALQVWLPLNGKIENQGISGIAINGSPASWSSGPLGKCATFTGKQIIKSASVHDFDYIDNFSWACWVNTNRGSGAEYIFSVGRVDMKTFGYGLECYTTTQCRIWFGSWTVNIPVTGGKWTHIAFTKSGSTIKIYLNGKLEQTVTFNATMPTFADSVGIGIGCFHYSGGDIYYYNGSIADFRIYDNALSPKEVHEIAQGLCCHYPLNDPYATGSINKYSGDNFEGKPSGSSYTVTKLANERGYNYKLSYTGTGNNTWPNFYFPTFSFTAGKTYDYSCKVRCHSKNFNISFRAAHISNDWVTSMKTITVADNQWHEYHIQIKLDAKYTRSGTEYDTKPLVEFYSESLATKDMVYTCDFDLKDVCVSECSTAASGSNGSWADNIVYDTSGFGNHGKSNSSEFISCTKDTPRYQASYYFANSGTPNISMPNFAFEDMTCGTVNLWINRYSATSTWRNYLSFADGYNWTGNKADFIILGTTGNPGLSMDCCSNVVTVDYGLKKWNMYTIAWDLVTHTAKYFVNGELIKTITNDRIGTEYAKAHGQIFIGNAWYTESDYALSDFRMYATALSDADVAALYNTPVSITSNGAMIMKGELIET
jgi:hypothetical protein